MFGLDSFLTEKTRRSAISTIMVPIATPVSTEDMTSPIWKPPCGSPPTTSLRTSRYQHYGQEAMRLGYTGWRIAGRAWLILW